MAISTYQAHLMYTTTSEGTYTELVSIKDFPDLGGPPDMLETTHLGNKAHTYLPGIQTVGGLEFTANFDQTSYNTIKGLAGAKTWFALWFGETALGVPDGSKGGKFEFVGEIDVHLTGGGVNEVVEMVITIAPYTKIVKASS